MRRKSFGSILRLWLGALLPAAVLLAAPGGAARAGVLGDTKTAYSAERMLTIDGRSYQGMLYAEPGRQRHVQNEGGIQEVAIFDLGSGTGIFELPQIKSYLDFKIGRAVAALSVPDIAGKPVGREAIEGISVTKYRVAQKASDGTRIDGLLWLTAEGIPMRAQGAVTETSGKRTQFSWILSHLQVGPQDEALFEPPEGFHQLPAMALPSFLNGTVH